MGKKIKLRGSIGESQSKTLTTTTPISYLESRVRFSFRDCDIEEYCIRNLSNKEIERLYKRLGHFEQLRWQQIVSMSREDGFSVEKKESQNHQKLSQIFSNFNTFSHFRINGTDGVFRVFGAQNEDLFYILWLDKNGVVNH